MMIEIDNNKHFDVKVKLYYIALFFLINLHKL